jgi:copper homeostasis protein
MSSVCIEVAVDSLPAALLASKAGAGRLELCASLDSGGVTPSLGLLAGVLEQVTLPVMVLVRPRSGDFVYGAGERRVVQRDIRSLLGAGAAGVVVGALDAHGDLDFEAMRAWLDAAEGAPLTFHRAFDCTSEPLRTHGQLVELGVQRVLTSGGAARVIDGLPMLVTLASRVGSEGYGTILPAGGLRSQDVARVVDATGVREVHTSGRTENSTLLPGSGEYQGSRLPDPDELRAMAAELAALGKS